MKHVAWWMVALAFIGFTLGAMPHEKPATFAERWNAVLDDFTNDDQDKMGISNFEWMREALKQYIREHFGRDV
jgi:hypothetical protein